MTRPLTTTPKIASRIIRLTAIVVMAITLSSCTNIGPFGHSPFGHSMWHGTQSVAKNAAAKNTANLWRAAPYTNQHYAKPYRAAYAYQQPHYKRQPIATGQQQSYAPRQTYGLRGQFNQSHVNKQNTQRRMSAPKIASHMPLRSLPMPVTMPMRPKTFSEGDELSYVKIGGGSSMADWKNCEQSAGGYFTPTPTGYRLNAQFDRCMRAKDYIAESEAHNVLRGSNNRARSMRAHDMKAHEYQTPLP